MFNEITRSEHQNVMEQTAPLPALLESPGLQLDRYAVDHCSDAVFWMEPDGRVFRANDPAGRLLGYENRELLGKFAHEIFPGFSANAWAEHWHSLLKAPCITLESMLVAKNGQQIPVAITTRRICFGDRAYHCAFVKDLTEKKQDERKTRSYEIRLGLSQRMEALGTLAGGIAHDFNNILSAILGYAELSLEGLPTEAPQRDYLQEVITAGTRARELVHQILSFSRKADRTVQPLQFKTIAKEALKLLRASIPSTIDIHTTMTSDGLVMADAGHLHQIVMNLCANAAQALPAEGGVMQVCLESVTLEAAYTAHHPGLEPGRFLRWKVTGMGKAAAPGGPEPGATSRTSGTGAGLSVVRGIVSEYNGHMSEEHMNGCGTSVSVFLPLLERPKPPVAEKAENLPVGTGNERILVVDDEAAVAKMLTMMLQRLNYQVTSRTSSIEALALFKEQSDHFDLVITDLTMPNLPGQKLAAELARIRSGIPVILCTGYSSDISEARAARAGIQATITKPIDKATLARTLRALLDKAAI